VPPTPNSFSASGPPSGLLRYTASRPSYRRPVPPCLILSQRRAHRPDCFGTPLRGLLTAGRSPHALLLSHELRDSLVFVGAQSLRRICTRERLRQQLALERQAFPLAALHSGLDCALDEADRLTRFVRRNKLAGII